MLESHVIALNDSSAMSNQLLNLLKSVNWRGHPDSSCYVVDIENGTTFSEVVLKLFEMNDTCNFISKAKIFAIFGKPTEVVSKAFGYRLDYKVVMIDSLPKWKQKITHYSVKIDSLEGAIFPRVVIIDDGGSSD